MGFIKKVLPTLIVATILAVGFSYFYQPTLVRGVSMYPTFKDYDYVMINKNIYRHSEPEYGDIVVFKEGGNLLIKRLIGKPGDKISFKDGNVYRNDKKLNEKYVRDKETKSYIGDVVFLNDDQYFLMGDNRPDSLDCRDFGPISKDLIVGKATLRLFPRPTKDFSY